MSRLRPALALAALCACQSYNLDPVQPRAIRVADVPTPVEGHRLPPNLMFVVDRSGSFTDRSDGTPLACADSRGYTGDRGQDCKWNNLLDAMVGPPGAADGGFLAVVDGALEAGGDRARLGLVTYSDREGGGDCAAGRLRVPIPTAPTSTAAAIRRELLATAPAGATPTAATLAALPALFPPAEVGRDNYALLLTDGAPNCDATLTATQAACGGDRCTVSGGCAGWDSCSCNPDLSHALAPQLCLDDDALVAAVAALQQAGIKTFVIGFGADTARGSAHDTLNRAAVAGGVPNTTQPGFDYYQATTLSDLNRALLAILKLVGNTCQFELAGPPVSDQALQVIVTAPGAPACASDADCPAGLCAGPDQDRRCGRELAPAEYQLEGTQVTVLDVPPGNACQALSNATPASHARIEFRYVAR